MSGQRIIDGLQDALAVVRGDDQPGRVTFSSRVTYPANPSNASAFVATGAQVAAYEAEIERLKGLCDEYALAEAETDLAFKDLDLRIQAAEARATAAEARVREAVEGLRVMPDFCGDPDCDSAAAKHRHTITHNTYGEPIPTTMFHVEDPRAEVRDSETGEVIFPAVKGPLKLIKGDAP